MRGGGIPLISIIIPVYNGEKYIENCYKCLNNQTYKNLEIIFINDGSTDNSKNILESLAKKDNRVILIHKKNGGVSSARNAGMDIAKGEYISFYDVDDDMDRCFFEVMLNDAIKYEVDLVISMNAYLKDNSNEEKRSDNHFFDLAGQVFEYADQFYIDYFSIPYESAAGIYNAVWGKLFSKKILKNARFKCDMKYFEDTLFMFEILSKSPKAYFDAFQGYTYVLRSESAVGSLKNNYIQSCKFWSDRARFYTENYKLCHATCSSKVIIMANENFETYIYRVLYYLIKNNEKEYYKQNKNLYTQFIRKMTFVNVPVWGKLYLKLYLFSSPLCWYVSRCAEIFRRIKSNERRMPMGAL